MQLKYESRKPLSEISINASISWILKVSMLLLIPYAIYYGKYIEAGSITVSIVVSLLPSILARSYQITLPWEIDLLITVALYLHVGLGSTFEFYEKYRFYDKFLHFVNTAIICILAFILVFSLHFTGRVNLNYFYMSFFIFIFALAMGSLWEIGEFFFDKIFGTKTQDSLEDTMWDLILDGFGGIFIGMLGYFYAKYSKPQHKRKVAAPVRELIKKGWFRKERAEESLMKWIKRRKSALKRIRKI